MFDTHQSVVSFLETVLPELSDYAGAYGEPGYSLDEDARTPLVVFGNYWCRCHNYAGDRDQDRPLHDVAVHYPHAFARLEEQGVVLEWLDEWIVDHETDKAYRSTSDSYSWKPSLIVTDDGDFLTPDNDLDDWLEYVANEPTRCLPEHIYSASDLEDAGFERWGEEYASGWYEGQNDDPTSIDAAIRAAHEEDVDVVFILDSTGQFDLHFSAYVRPRDDS